MAASNGASKKLPLNQKAKEMPTNPRGIPQAIFVDKVEDYVTSRDQVEGTLKSFQEMISYVRSRRVLTRHMC